MALPFARSIRSMHGDTFQIAVIALIVALILMSVWMTWFFLAQITLYERSSALQRGAGENIVAYFPSTAHARIRPQQRAMLYLEGDTARQHPPVPALVTDVASQPQTERIQVTMYVFWGLVYGNAPPPELIGHVDIETEYVSPATLVMRAAGEYVEAPQIRTSPQELPQTN